MHDSVLCARVELEVSYGIAYACREVGKTRSIGCETVARDRIFLRNVAKQLDRLVDLICTIALLSASHGDFVGELYAPIHLRTYFVERLVDLFGGLHGTGHERHDLVGCCAASFGKLTDFGCHDSKAAPVLASACCLHGCIEGEDVGLAGDFRHDANLSFDF